MLPYSNLADLSWLRSSETFYEFFVLESGGFFLGVEPILKALQQLSKNPIDISFQDYLTGNQLKVNQPRYIRNLSNIPLIKSTSQLDETQRQAFEFALRSELCLIQGPPGTGKTVIQFSLFFFCFNGFLPVYTSLSELKSLLNSIL